MATPSKQNGFGLRNEHATPESMSDYRAVARKKLLPKGYSGYVHLLWLFSVSLLIMVACVHSMNPLSWVDILSYPVALALANAYEYAIHRYPGHVTLSAPPFKYFFKSHTGLHHRFYTYGRMQPDLGHQDYYFTLFPLKVYATWFLSATAPIMLVGRFFLPWNTCAIVASVGSFYLVLYEVLHSYAHTSLPGPVLKAVACVPGAAFVKQHHRIHHHPRLMTSCNFNLTFPLTDWLVGTLVTKVPD